MIETSVSTQNRQIIAAITKAQFEGKIISHGVARTIGSIFYGPHGNDGYSFVTTGEISGPRKVWTSMNEAFFPGGKNMISEHAENWHMLSALGMYLLEHGKRGPVEGWSDMWMVPEDYA